MVQETSYRRFMADVMECNNNYEPGRTASPASPLKFVLLEVYPGSSRAQHNTLLLLVNLLAEALRKVEVVEVGASCHRRLQKSPKRWERILCQCQCSVPR